MNREDLLAELFPFVDGTNIGRIMTCIDAYAESLGVQSPAPDEKDAEIADLKAANDALQGVHEGDLKALEALSELKSLAPSAEKDPEKEELIAKIRELQEKYDENGYDFPPIVQLGRVESNVDGAFGIWQKQYNELKAKSAKLIEALEWAAREIGEPDHPNSYTIEKVLQGIEDALATYKGKEGGEG